MKYGLIGQRLGHSFSKEIHEQIGKYEYELKELDANEFISFMEKKDFKAINVTIPYKEKVIPYLHYISDEAKRIGAVNVIVNKDGLLYGYNTDYLGLKEMINHFNIDLNNKNVLILGTGGTSKTSYNVAKDLNANKVSFVSSSKKDNALSYEDLDKYANDYQILINTTPKEMYPNNYESIVSLDSFNNLEGVIDVIFNPLRTSLILKAKKKNIKYCSGLFMLVAQAFYAIEIFLETKLDKQIIIDVYNNLINQKENIVLIGMPSCGKTTIGKHLSKNTNKTLIDIDEEIEKEINMKIKDFFKEHSENEFREIETKVIKEIAKMQNLIIATGGGAILKKENVDALKQNGKLFFLDRDLKKLKYTSSRPLSSSIDALKNLYKTRYPIYKDVCDVRIDANCKINDVVNKILGGK